jgi:hypothetical protein
MHGFPFTVIAAFLFGKIGATDALHIDHCQ